MKKYGIEIIGYGKKQKFCIKEILKNWLLPVNGKAYSSKEEAIEAAKELNIDIACIGDFYALI